MDFVKNNAAGAEADAAKVAPEDAAFGSPHPDPAKQLDFGVTGAATPATPAAMPAAPQDASDEIDYDLFIKETLLWTNKIRSSFYFAVGLLLWVVARSVILSNTTLVTGTCYLLLSSLAFNFLRGVFMPELQKRCTWSHSSWTKFVNSADATVVAAAASLHDSYLHGLDPLRTLEVGLALWGLSVLGRAVDAVTLLLVLHVAAFILPLAYTTQQAKVNAAISDAYGKFKVHYDTLDRKVKAGIVLGFLALLFFLLPSSDRLAAGFIFVAYTRAILKPNEYASLQKKLEPVANTVKRMGTNVSSGVVSTMNKFELTPTPAKKKNV